VEADRAPVEAEIRLPEVGDRLFVFVVDRSQHMQVEVVIRPNEPVEVEIHRRPPQLVPPPALPVLARDQAADHPTAEEDLRRVRRVRRCRHGDEPAVFANAGQRVPILAGGHRILRVGHPLVVDHELVLVLSGAERHDDGPDARVVLRERHRPRVPIVESPGEKDHAGGGIRIGETNPALHRLDAGSWDRARPEKDDERKRQSNGKRSHPIHSIWRRAPMIP